MLSLRYPPGHHTYCSHTLLSPQCINQIPHEAFTARAQQPQKLCSQSKPTTSLHCPASASGSRRVFPTVFPPYSCPFPESPTPQSPSVFTLSAHLWNSEALLVCLIPCNLCMSCIPYSLESASGQESCWLILLFFIICYIEKVFRYSLSNLYR